MHRGRPANKQWGSTGERNAGQDIIRFLARRQCGSLLDFGCGTGSLGRAIQSVFPSMEVAYYDPGRPEYDKIPKGPWDTIVSADVLEHVEPEQIDATLAWMRNNATKYMFHHIACDPCSLILPDGRNAHLIVQNPDWWLEKFLVDGWELQIYRDIVERKRGMLRRSVQIGVDRV